MRRLTDVIIVIVLIAGFWPQPSHAAGTLFLAPSSGSLQVGSSGTVSLLVDSGGDAINAAQATVTFPSDLLQINAVSKGSLFTLWPVEPSISGASVTFAGGVPDPGYNGRGGSILTVSFTALAEGTATITVSGASLLANDGLGTNILGGVGGATLTIQAAPAGETPAPSPTSEPAPPTEEAPSVLPVPVIVSDTHPDQERWYADSDPAFRWDSLEGATGFSFVFDDQPDTIPDDEVDSTENTIVYPGTRDGVWTFHVKVLNEAGWSETGHFTVQIDTTPPEVFAVRLEGDQPTKDRTPNINFIADDVLSGIAKYIVISGEDVLETVFPGNTQPYTLSALDYGTNTITVRAIDNAGNIRVSTIDIEIIEHDPESGFWIGETFVSYAWIALGIGALAILLLLLVILLLFLCCRRRKKDDRRQANVTSKGRKRRAKV